MEKVFAEQLQLTIQEVLSPFERTATALVLGSVPAQASFPSQPWAYTCLEVCILQANRMVEHQVRAWQSKGRYIRLLAEDKIE